MSSCQSYGCVRLGNLLDPLDHAPELLRCESPGLGPVIAGTAPGDEVEGIFMSDARYDRGPKSATQPLKPPAVGFTSRNEFDSLHALNKRGES